MTRSVKASRYLWVLTKISSGNAAESLCLSRKIGTFSTVTVANPTAWGAGCAVSSWRRATRRGMRARLVHVGNAVGVAVAFLDCGQVAVGAVPTAEDHRG
jgi:hypothetical protein